MKKKTAPWFRVSVSCWPLVVDQLSGEWDEEIVIADLRWWEDQISVGRACRVPSRRKLMARWGWSDHRVRSMLRDVDRWSASTSNLPTTSQPSPNVDPAPTVSTPNIICESPNNLPTISQQSPHALGDRAQSTEHREDTYTSGKPAEVSEPVEAEQGGTIHQLRLAPTIEDPPPEKPMTPIDHFEEILDVYLTAATAHAERTGGRKPRTPRLRPKTGRGIPLSARIKDHGPEAVKLVVRWWQTSDDDRAQLLRGEIPGKGPYSWDTVCRPGNFETYLEMAERWEDLGAVESAGSTADLDRAAREAWIFLRRCIDDRSFYRREVPDPRSPTWPHRIRATLDRLGTTFNDLQRSSLYELDRMEGRFMAAHTDLRRGTA